MTVKDLAKVMGTQFIAVGSKATKRINYSGQACKLKSMYENAEIIEVVIGKNEFSATIIWVA